MTSENSKENKTDEGFPVTTQKKYEAVLGRVTKEIQRAIENSGYSEQEVASKMKVSREFVNMLRNGKRKPSLQTLFILSHITGTKLKITLE